MYDEKRALFGRKRSNGHDYGYRERQKSVKPNIIFVLTDDQDVALGKLPGISLRELAGLTADSRYVES